MPASERINLMRGRDPEYLGSENGLLYNKNSYLLFSFCETICRKAIYSLLRQQSGTNFAVPTIKESG